MAKPSPEPAYRPCVGAFLLNRDGLVFVGQRANFDKNAWQMPQGGIDGAETPRAAVIRELAEETGIRKVEILAESEQWLSYDLPPELRDSTWNGRYCGQTQKWFALRFLGVDADIDLDAGPICEFSSWKWVAIQEVPALAVSFKRHVYEKVVEEFGKFACPPTS
jgi:putative (di)nucleoside polyphosphate hydrolase